MFTKIKMLALFIGITCGAHAQKFHFGQLPKPAKHRSAVAGETAPLTQNIFGPVANLVSYAITDNSLMYGAGFGYKHMRWDEAKQEWLEIWSVNALAWDKVSLVSQPNTFAYGVAGGFTLGKFYGKGLVGVATTDITQISKYFPTVGITLPINR